VAQRRGDGRFLRRDGSESSSCSGSRESGASFVGEEVRGAGALNRSNENAPGSAAGAGKSGTGAAGAGLGGGGGGDFVEALSLRGICTGSPQQGHLPRRPASFSLTFIACPQPGHVICNVFSTDDVS
jgi:hypothetical protein